jgi:hypothetical protein
LHTIKTDWQKNPRFVASTVLTSDLHPITYQCWRSRWPPTKRGGREGDSSRPPLDRRPRWRAPASPPASHSFSDRLLAAAYGDPAPAEQALPVGPTDADYAWWAAESDRLASIDDTLGQLDDLHASGEWGRMLDDCYGESAAADAHERGLIFA